MNTQKEIVIKRAAGADIFDVLCNSNRNRCSKFLRKKQVSFCFIPPFPSYFFFLRILQWWFFPLGVLFPPNFDDDDDLNIVSGKKTNTLRWDVSPGNSTRSHPHCSTICRLALVSWERRKHVKYPRTF